MMKNLFKKWTAIITLLYAPIFAYAQTTLRDSIEQSIDYLQTDLPKAESLLKINKDKLSQEPDSIILDYYYYSAAVLEFKNDTTIKKTQLLLKAKALMEKSLGINQAVYFEIINAIGEQLYDKKRFEEAKLIWEEGLIKGLQFSSYKDYPIGQNINSIRKNLSELYDKNGDSYISTWLKVEHTKGSFDSAVELVEKALKTQDTNPAESIKMLDEAKVIFLESGVEGQEMLGPLYRNYISAYAHLNKHQICLGLIKQHKNLIINSAGFDSYIDDLVNLVSIFSLTHFDVKKANPFFDILKTDISKASENKCKEFMKYERGYLYLCDLQHKIDSLNTKCSRIPKEQIDKLAEVSYELCLLYGKRNQYNKVLEISEEYNNKLKSFKSPNIDLRWKYLVILINTSLRLQNYVLGEEYSKEAITLLNNNKTIIADYDIELNWMYNKLSMCLINQKKIDEALILNRLVLKNFESIYGVNSREYSIVLHNKGRIYQLKKEYKKARDIYKESLRISKSLHQQDNPKTLQYLKEVENILKAQL